MSNYFYKGCNKVNKKKLNFIFLTADKAGSGKDTVGKMLQKCFRKYSKTSLCYSIAFATPLIENYKQLIQPVDVYGEFNPIFYKKTKKDRELFQKWASAVKSVLGWDIFLKKTVKDLDSSLIDAQCDFFNEDKIYVIITDLRLMQEYDYILKHYDVDKSYVLEIKSKRGKEVQDRESQYEKFEMKPYVYEQSYCYPVLNLNSIEELESEVENIFLNVLMLGDSNE